MNFKIIEGEDTRLTDIYDDFKTDFLNPSYSVRDLMKKYDISFNHYNKLRKSVCLELGISCKPKSEINKSRLVNEDTYINRYGKKYAIFKTLNHKRCSFGVYDDLETARLVRNELLKCNWDINCLDEIYRRVKGSEID